MDSDQAIYTREDPSFPVLAGIHTAKLDCWILALYAGSHASAAAGSIIVGEHLLAATAE
jgi:hypothetical protein